MVSLETQTQEQLKPDLEDEQREVSAGTSPCFKSESPQCEFGKILPAQKESLGVAALHWGAHSGFGVNESGIH